MFQPKGSSRRGTACRLAPFLAFGLVLWVAGSVPAFGMPETRPRAKIYRIRPAAGPIKVDGRFNDPGWRDALVIPLSYEIQPGENLAVPVATECRLTYDRNSLYLACVARDPDPAAIRARFTDRDASFDDDFVGILIDTFDDQRTGYEFFVNPLGVQMDLTQSDVGGGEDSSWDAIWSSAGRITDKGYQVEMAIPFSILQFPDGGGELTWGISVLRAWPRDLRHILASEPRDRSVACDLCQISRITGFEGIEPGKSVEIDPTLVLKKTDRRDEVPGGRLKAGSIDPDGGVTVRWGVSPNLQVAGTVNPDFFQVEADVAQLSINRQFTLFFPEKRPFFLDGATLFDTPFLAVNTRAISDPNWGVKVAGKEGRSAFAGMVAQDAVTTVIIPGSQSSWDDTLDGSNLSGVFRYRFDVGGSSTLGALVTSRSGEGGYQNTLWGLDGHLRLGDTDTLYFQGLGSKTEYPSRWAEANDLSDRVQGSALRVIYEHDSRDWDWDVHLEDRDPGFRADLGFMPQVDLRMMSAGLFRTWWGEPGDWYTRVQAGGRFTEQKDHSGQILDRESELWAELHGPWQSDYWINLTSRDVFYGGRVFDQRRFHFFAWMRPSGTLLASIQGSLGDEVDYDNVRPAKMVRLAPEMEVALGRHLRLSLRHTYERLRVDEGRLYRANLSELRGVYQFSLRTFVRAIVQYRDVWRDPRLYSDDVEATSREFFTQLLFSYKINPQTVFFVGYSDFGIGGRGYAITRTDRTLFVKLGYAWLL